MSDAAAHSALVWIDPEQVALAAAVCAQAGVRIVSAGTGIAGRAREVAEGLGLAGEAGVDDLRAALGSTEARLVLLGAPIGGGEEAVRLVREAMERGVMVASLEPIPAGILEVDAESPGVAGAAESMGVALGPEPTDESDSPAVARPVAQFLPLARHSRPIRESGEIIGQLGTISMVGVQAFAGTGQGSLGARLYDAMELVVWLMGSPERVDAAYVPPSWGARAGGVHPAPGDTLRGLDGDLSANLRFGDGRAASIVASSRAGKWSRTVTLVGEKGRVRFFDDGLEWVAPDGKVIDATRDAARVRGSGRTEPTIAPAARAMAEQIVWMLEGGGGVGGAGGGTPTNVVSVLASTGAALLSARTGEGESPDTILRMARAG